MNERAVAAKLLAQLVDQQGSLATLMAPALNKVEEKNRSLLQALCFGVCRWQPRLDAYLGALMDKPLRAKEKEVRALLWVGLYQLEHMRVPDHAAINSTVEAAKALKKNWACKLVNAVLRNFIRRREQLEKQLAEDNEFNSAHPHWLLQAFTKAWAEQKQHIISANNAHPPLTLRVNRQQLPRDDYLSLLQQHNIEAFATAYSSDGLTLREGCDITQLPGYAQGQFSVQDESPQLCADLMQLQPNLKVLDACCAPGGKTAHLLERESTLKLTAVDVSAARIATTQENLQRLQIENVELRVGDSAEPKSWWQGELFDRILLDAPCSASGIIRRQPDIKILRDAATVAKLVALQQRMLTQLWPLLKPGGLLLYATCSIFPQENNAQIDAFLQATRDARELPIDANWGLAQTFGRQCLPTIDGGDGFYYARLQKLGQL